MKFDFTKEETADLLNVMGISYLEDNVPDKALSFFKKALNVQKQLWGDNHPEIANTLDNISMAYAQKEENDKAIEFGRKAFLMMCHSEKFDNLDFAEICMNLGAHYVKKKAYHDAYIYFFLASDSFTRALGKNHISVYEANIKQVTTQLKAEKYDNVIKVLVESIEISGALKNVSAAYYCMFLCGVCYYKMKEYELSLINLVWATSDTILTFGMKDKSLPELYYYQGLVNVELYDYKQAIYCFDVALQLYKKINEFHPKLCTILENIAETLEKQGNTEKAQIFRQKAENFDTEIGDLLD